MIYNESFRKIKKTGYFFPELNKVALCTKIFD
jgi:hypothetical protein